MATGGGEKTEKATDKKRRDAREEGQVLKSAEVNTAFCTIVMFVLLLIVWQSFSDKLALLLTEYLSSATLLGLDETLSGATFRNILGRALMDMGRILLPILGTAMAAGLVINVLQVGFLFTTKTLQPKADRINMLKGFGRIFSTRTLVELLKSILKIVVLGFIAYTDYKKMMVDFPDYMGQNVGAAFMLMMRTAFLLAIKMAAAFAIIAAGDFIFQWWKREKDMRMTKQEVIDERKLMDGDPQIKSRIRQKQRQMSTARMMDAVRTADVVIKNPTHFAVALKYDAQAPIVVAKGADHLARKILERAEEYHVETVENRTLARTLYDNCDVGDEIPRELFTVVADILVAVSRKTGKSFL
ncbi:MAG: flagellar biosynthesis protein FlhB [Oscillospiraceae bacterium]|jgi:flagellar biosynthetic protein FlhB|nr:flagellar biosynthesis protein FlhB [Oscillospiraceae bacterium]